MNKKIISVLLSLIMIFGMIPIETVASNEAAEPIEVYVSIADKGEVVMAYDTITVTDMDASGDFTVDEVLYAAHESAFEGGASAGYASAMTDYGLSIKTLWGDTSGNFGYWLNDASCWSLADKVNAGDSLVAFVYQNTTVWDSYSKFTQNSYASVPGEAVTVSLEKAGYDENWNTVFAGHAGATIKVYDKEFAELGENIFTVRDKGDGIYEVTVYDSGDYFIVAYDNATPIVPAVCLLNADKHNSRKNYKNYKAVYEATADYISKLETPGVGGEWMIMALTRSGYDCPEGYYDNVVEYVKNNINENEQLSSTKSTDNSRVILGLTSAGYDVTNVDGHNLLMGLTDMSYVTKQGVNGSIWVLLAFDSYAYEIPANPSAAEQLTREGLISYILDKQLEDGGWDFFGTAADADMTGMAIQALAPYYSKNEAVKTAIDKAVACLSEKQLDNGGFGYNGELSSESCAQVIIALTTLGIDPSTDERFIKNDKSVMDAMCMLAVKGGGFEHVSGGGLNAIATQQCQQALVSYFRLIDDKNTFYDMRDVIINNETPEPASTIDVNVSIADKGKVVMANRTITVSDNDASGDFTVDEVLYAAHEDAYVGGAKAGYASAMTDYGLSIMTLWGDESGNYGYWLNDASCWSLEDKVNAGDSLVAFVYQNTTVWDSYSKFAQRSYSSEAGAAVSVSLEKAGYDESWNTVFAGHAGATIKVYDEKFTELFEDSYTVSDKGDGTYEVTVYDSGDYIIAAYDNATPIVPAICTLSVKGNNGYYCGDVNKDGSITADDALMILRNAAKLDTISDEMALALADYDHNGEINAADALEVLKTAAKINELKNCEAVK